MLAIIKKCVVKEIKRLDCGSNKLKVVCESIIDLANMSALEILQSKGILQYSFYLSNCVDRIDELSKAMIGKPVSVCVYEFEVSELTDKGTKARIYDCEDEVDITSTLTYAVPCADDFNPSQSDYITAREKLKADLENRMGFEIIEKEEKTDEKGITGYLVIDGTVVNVNSVEDLKHIVKGNEQFAPF